MMKIQSGTWVVVNMILIAIVTVTPTAKNILKTLKASLITAYLLLFLSIMMKSGLLYSLGGKLTILPKASKSRNTKGMRIKSKLEEM